MSTSSERHDRTAPDIRGGPALGDVWQRVIAEIEAFREGIRELPVSRTAEPHALRSDLAARYDLDRPVPLDVLVADVCHLLRTRSVHVTHPRYFGLFNPSVRLAGIIGDALAALYNPQLAVWSHAPAAQELERLVLRRFTEALGLDIETTLSNFTTGGAEANLSAVLAALAHAFPEAGRQGVGAIRARPVIYLSEDSHHSFVKIARMTGLGTDVLRTVPTTRSFAMDADALAERVRGDVAAGYRPFMIVATAGTTATGAIDPLMRVAEVARQYGAWFHVDAAWGGSAVLSPRLRGALAGIERADSVTWDAHKWLSVPMGAGMFFCRHADAIRRAFDITTSYMPAETAQVDDLYRTSVQWSRRAIGLKVFLSVAELALPGYGELVDRMARMGGRLRERLREAGWIIANDTPLPVVCFTHPAVERGDATVEGILALLHERGRVWVSQVTPAGGPTLLRACITSYVTDETDLECLVEELEVARTAVEVAARRSLAGPT